MDRTRIPVSIDIGFSDIIYPDRVEMNYPTQQYDEQLQYADQQRAECSQRNL